MFGPYLGSCFKAREHFKIGDEIHCCGSCHEDQDELGYEMCTLITDDGYWELCCKVDTAVEEKRNEYRRLSENSNSREI